MLIDNLVTRFQNGVTNRSVGSIFASMKQMDPTIFHTYFEDFDYYTAANWTVTEVGVATQVLSDFDGGALLISTAALDNDSSFQQKVGESFQLALGRKLFFKCRFQVSDAVESDVVIGLQVTDTTPLSVTDGIFFLKSDGLATIDLQAKKDNIAVVSSAIATVVNNTPIELSFFWDGIDRIWFGVGDAPTGILVPGTSLPDDEILTLSFGMQNGVAGGKTMAVDYIYVAEER